MATNRTAIWSLGESVLWYTPTSGLDPVWSLGESILLDEYASLVPVEGFETVSAVCGSTFLGTKLSSGLAALAADASCASTGYRVGFASVSVGSENSTNQTGFKSALSSEEVAGSAASHYEGAVPAFQSGAFAVAGCSAATLYGYKKTFSSDVLAGVAGADFFGGLPTLLLSGRSVLTGLSASILSGSKKADAQSALSSCSSIFATGYKATWSASEFLANPACFAGGVKTAHQAVGLEGVGGLDAAGLNISFYEIWDAASAICRVVIPPVAVFDDYSAIYRQWDGPSPVARIFDDNTQVIRAWDANSKLRGI